MRSEKLRKNQYGFSLVELIIVMAIMVVLIAVLAPQFTKYVQRARDTVIEDAANQALAMVKTEYAIESLKFTDDCPTVEEGNKSVKQAEIVVQARSSDNHLTMKLSGLMYNGKTGDNADVEFMKACGIDEKAQTKSNIAYKIIIKGDNSISRTTAFALDVEMEETPKDPNI